MGVRNACTSGFLWCGVLSAAAIPSWGQDTDAAGRPLTVLDTHGRAPEQRVAITGVCAWPNLTQTPDGRVFACIFNKASHGGVADGAIDCYEFTEADETWENVGVVAAPDPEPPSLRQNHAVGLAPNGDLVALTSGYVVGSYEGAIAPAWISRSLDDGRTWQVDKVGSGIYATPYGDIELAQNGDLLTACYYNFNDVAVYRSSDSGKTWDAENRVPLGTGPGSGNETDILHLGDGEWIAVARDEERGKAWIDPLTLYRSADDAHTWHVERHVTGAYQHPGELTLLRDGDVLLTYGDRSGGAGGSSRVEIKISRDRGHTWSRPRRVANFPGFDGGYPSSVELGDGSILTVYYSQAEGGYHMGHVLWDLETTAAGLF